jgi:hypothetical protein
MDALFELTRKIAAAVVLAGLEPMRTKGSMV